MLPEITNVKVVSCWVLTGLCLPGEMCIRDSLAVAADFEVGHAGKQTEQKRLITFSGSRPEVS